LLPLNSLSFRVGGWSWILNGGINSGGQVLQNPTSPIAASMSMSVPGECVSWCLRAAEEESKPGEIHALRRFSGRPSAGVAARWLQLAGARDSATPIHCESYTTSYLPCITPVLVIVDEWRHGCTVVQPKYAPSWYDYNAITQAALGDYANGRMMRLTHLLIEGGQ
jgi:hypothetical protein